VTCSGGSYSTTSADTETIEGPLLTCGQQRAGFSRREQNKDKGDENPIGLNTYHGTFFH
jgi:hypothetical protein